MILPSLRTLIAFTAPFTVPEKVVSNKPVDVVRARKLLAPHTTLVKFPPIIIFPSDCTSIASTPLEFPVKLLSI